MKIAMFASEMEPYAKTGGLADVLGSFPRILVKKKVIEQVDVFIPFYRDIYLSELNLEKVNYECNIKLASKTHKMALYRLKNDKSNLNVYFIDNYHFFRRRSQLYVKDGKDYHDNLARFVFFCKGALEAIKYFSDKKEESFYDILHCHDWQTALIPLYTELSGYFSQRLPLRIYTIHNLAYQGKFSKSKFMQLGIDKKFYDPKYLEFWGQINLMKAGIIFSDIVTTVSPTYGKEIQTGEYGAGLEKFLKNSNNKLYGILNGVDYDAWNPEIDPYIKKNYSIEDLSGKRECKIDLQQFFNFKKDLDIPILSVISRLVWQKGMDLVIKVLPEILKRNDVQFILLGTGEKKLEERFQELENRYPSQIGISLVFNDRLAHRIEAGADIFLMPSRYEPCGLNDKYSLRYGTVPIVNNTGGLADSVIDYSRDPKNGTGFIFKNFSEGLFEDAIYRALKVFQSKSEWQQLMKRSMLQNFSWSRAADEYIKLYQQKIDIR